MMFLVVSRGEPPRWSAAKDLTPAAHSVSAFRVWSFGEVLRCAQDDMESHNA